MRLPRLQPVGTQTESLPWRWHGHPWEKSLPPVTLTKRAPAEGLTLTKKGRWVMPDGHIFILTTAGRPVKDRHRLTHLGKTAAGPPRRQGAPLHPPAARSHALTRHPAPPRPRQECGGGGPQPRSETWTQTQTGSRAGAQTSPGDDAHALCMEQSQKKPKSSCGRSGPSSARRRPCTVTTGPRV